MTTWGRDVMRITAISALGICGLLAGCAASPESIAPSYVSPVAYQNWSCAQLAEDEGRLHSAYVMAAGEQSDARTTDTVGVLLLGLPVGSMTGENVAPQVASLKGQLDAVHQSETVKNCDGQASLSSDAPSYGVPSSEQYETLDAWEKEHAQNAAPH
jgi:hypothetical protein